MQAYCLFAQIYIDNIVIFSKIFKKYIKYLYTVFDLFNSKKVILLIKKFYLEYFIVIFLS